MLWLPQGQKGLQYWCRSLHYPLVAIGGVNQLRVADVMASGVEDGGLVER